MIEIDINEDLDIKIDKNLIANAAEAALSHHTTAAGDSLTVVITGDENIQQLNRQYRGIDTPTDVLSFEAGYQDPETNMTYLGDIIISYPQAKAQAESRDHTLEDEIQLLVVHGTLHLLGYDHGEPDQKAHMWTAQAAILKRLGISEQVVGDA